MILDITQNDGKINISYYNKEGKVEFKNYEVKGSANWAVCEKSDRRKSDKFKNWDGQPVRQARSFFMNKYSVLQFIEQDIPKAEKEEILALNFPKIYFVDIETEIIDGFPDAKNAASRILSISISTPDKKIMVLGTKPISKSAYKDIEFFINDHIKLSGKTFEFKYHCFDSEFDMLYTFLKEFVPKFPLMTGWNFVEYDWKYIRNRAIRLNIDPNICSPIEIKDKTYDIPPHIGILDYMDVYKKWDRTVALKENNGLDFAANAVLGIKKYKYGGTFQDIYETDYNKFVAYNAVDSILVQLIHEAIHTLDIVFTLSYLCKVSIYKAASPVSITETLLALKFLEKNMVMAIDETKKTVSGGKSKQYAGAYVKTPITGKHKAVACFDFASLYPSIMRQFNVSPESFKDKITVLPLKDDDPITRSRNREMLLKYKDKDSIVSITGAIYNKADSILKSILDELYAKRREYKKESLEHEAKVDAIKHEIEKRRSTFA